MNKGGKYNNYIIGIDEVGRGCLAGPVTVAAVLLPKKLRINNKILGELRDSKKLSSVKRQRWLQYIKTQPKIFYTISHIQPSRIDKLNISRAANLAATRAFKKLCLALDIKSVGCILLDGGLYLNNSFTDLKSLQCRTIVRGDEKYNCIKLASIAAKVVRDRLMLRLHEKYSVYGFDRHVGYGTEVHRAAIRKYGHSKPHRLTFLSKCIKN